MKAKEIIQILNRLAPEFLIDSWDNSGLQIGSTGGEVKKIINIGRLKSKFPQKAIREKVDMIITHHPFIFGKLSNISLDDEKGKMIRDIIKNDITVFSMHTNLDICEGGVNDMLCELLGIEGEKPLSIFNTSSPLAYGKIYGYGRVGQLNEKITLKEFSNIVNEELKCRGLRIYGDVDKKVKKVAVCGGSGSGFIKNASRENVDVYVTGDVRYHDAQLAKELGVSILDAGHYETEQPSIDLLKQYINENTKGLEIITYKESLAKFTTLN